MIKTFRKAMDQHGISIDGEPETKNGKGTHFEKQISKFAGIAKRKGKMGKVQSRSLVPDRKI